ncbi:hypothetical protein T484DRAFT_1878113 [Baffinella frigidus]|nr:hypothetical protein T484DRAFT_1878113 [Cryptophyta sp. CCMP2293]
MRVISYTPGWKLQARLMTSFGVETSEDFFSIGSMLADLHQHLLALRAYQTALRIDRLYTLNSKP